MLAATLATPAIPVAAAPSLDPGVPAGLRQCSADSEAYCGSVDVPLDRTGATPGSLSIAFRYYPRSDTSRPPLPTIVAHEGGPENSTTGSKSSYLDLYRPLMDRRALLLVDERGTGRSGALFCPEAETYDGRWIRNAEACAERLGRAADLYTTAAAVEDMADVLAELGIDAIDLYGESYGSFFAQAFAVRHPELVRSLVLDGTYPIEGLDPGYRTTGARLRENLVAGVCAGAGPRAPRRRAACSMCSPTCSPVPGHTPSSPRLPTPGGGRSRCGSPPVAILDALLNTDVAPGYIREVPAALTALRDGHPLPLARMVAEVDGGTADGPVSPGRSRAPAYVRWYSEGAYLAYACNDYPALWDVEASFARRERQYRRRDRGPRAGAFAPWTNAEWAGSEFFVYDYCLHWPAPRVADLPFPAGGRYPDVPDARDERRLRSAHRRYQAREVGELAERGVCGGSDYGHVTSVYEVDRCPSLMMRRFVGTVDAGDPYSPTGLRAPGRAGVRPEGRRRPGGDGHRIRRLDREGPSRRHRGGPSARRRDRRWYAIPGYSGTSL